MSRLRRAIEILEAIQEHFAGDTQNPLYPEAQILEGDVSIKQAIDDCIGHDCDL